MQSPRGSTVWLVLSVAQLAVLTWIAVHVASFEDSSRTPVQVAPGFSEDLDAVLRELGELTRALREGATLGPGLPAEPGRQPVTGAPDNAALAAAIAALAQTIRGLSWQNSPRNTVGALRDLHPEPKWGELSVASAAIARDHDRARRDLLLTPMAEILTRFGKPSAVFFNNKSGRVIWEYERESVDGDGQPATQTVTFWFRDGLLLEVDA